MEKEVFEPEKEQPDLVERCKEGNHPGTVSLDISPEMVGWQYCPTCDITYVPSSPAVEQYREQ